MALHFLRQHGSRRLRPGQEQTLLDPPGDGITGHPEPPRAQLDFEMPPLGWKPIPVVNAPQHPEELPRRFIDGSHVGQTVAWLQDADGHPLPVRLAEIGGVCLRAEGRELRREFAVVERVVSLIVEPFAAAEVKAFAAALRDQGLRLLPAQPPRVNDTDRALCFDFERMREQTRVRVQHEMEVLEEQALCHNPAVPTLVDGRLGRFQRAGLDEYSLVGVIKQQREPYLHAPGWRILYRLEPGQRTPAFQLPSKHLPVVSWYLKLDGLHGTLPNWGVVRVEIPLRQFERQGGDFGYLDRLSRGLFELRCRQGSYERSPVSLEPIVRAEESLKALLTPASTLTQQFYHLTGL